MVSHLSDKNKDVAKVGHLTLVIKEPSGNAGLVVYLGPMPTFAAIDVGSNSCRLKIARVVSHQLKTLHEDREVTRLGSSVFESGLISPEAMAATLRALKRFQRAVQEHAPDRMRVVATSAMRDARNATAFQAWVKAETGWNVEVISGLEEGRLIHRGVMSGEPGVAGRVLLIDLGGGSCEITLSENKRIRETISLPLGAVRLTEEFLTPPIRRRPTDWRRCGSSLPANCAVRGGASRRRALRR